jgi:hypothetical protein
MKRSWLLAWALFCAGGTILVAQENKAPQLSEQAKVKILKAQLELTRLQQRWAQLQEEAKALQGQAPAAQKALADAEDEAFKAAGVSKVEWALDDDKLVFVPAPKKPEPATPAKPEPKKP